MDIFSVTCIIVRSVHWLLAHKKVTQCAKTLMPLIKCIVSDCLVHSMSNMQLLSLFMILNPFINFHFLTI